MSELHFVKGHGTENDFIIIPDANGVIDLSDSRVRALCDLRAWLGADHAGGAAWAANLRPRHAVRRPAHAAWGKGYRETRGETSDGGT